MHLPADFALSSILTGKVAIVGSVLESNEYGALAKCIF